ncbi:autoinducer-2 kinase [Lutibacter sp. B2]|nr:autoinducer-2 kinase [Lutibacter sp. B2]
MKKYVMAIDAGTGSVRSVIFDENFTQIAVAQHEWTHKEDPRYEGAIDFDVEKNTKLMFDTIRQSIKTSGIDGKDIIAISTTSMREAFVLYDESGNEIWAVSNVDARASKEVIELKALSDHIEEDIYSISGQTFALGAIPRLLWVKNNLPDVYEKTKSITMLNDWIIYRLTGILSIEPSNASTTGILDSNKRNWDMSILEKCGLKQDMYPPIYESGTPVGKITKEIAELTGLSENCTVVVGGGDVQMGCIGIGVIKESQVALLGGSFWQLEYNTASPNIDKMGRIRVNCHAIPEMWQQELIAFYPGLVLRWFRDCFCQYEAQLAEKAGDDVYALLNEQAKNVPVGSNGILCSFSSIMDYKQWKHPSPCFTNFGIDSEKYSKATFYRAILENAALVTLGHKKVIEDLTGSFPDTLIFASGASNSSLWCQIVADVLGVTIKVPIIKEATALGAAFCAGVGIGLLPNFEIAAEKYVNIENVYTPNKENNALYEAIFNNWKQLSEAQTKNSDNGFLHHMWRAPGI